MTATTYYFGDSLTDNGNIFGALAAFLQPAILFQLSQTAPVTPELIALSEQLAIQQATAQLSNFGPNQALTNEFTHTFYASQARDTKVDNFAVAGARAIGEQEPFGPDTGYDSNLGGQVERFLTETSGVVAPGSSAVVFIGSNDFSDVFSMLASNPNVTPEQIEAAGATVIQQLLQTVTTATATLAATGIDKIYLGTLPLASFFPSFDGVPEELIGLADGVLATYNQLLAQAAEGLTLAGLDVGIIDFSAVASAVTEDPSSFGIIAAPDVYSGTSPAFDSDQIAFFDPLHPAEAVHQAWGAFSGFVMDGGESILLSEGRDVEVSDVRAYGSK